MFPDFVAYCQLIANLPEQFPSILSSTLIVYTIGPFTAEVEGQLIFSFEQPNLAFLIQEIEQRLKFHN